MKIQKISQTSGFKGTTSVSAKEETTQQQPQQQINSLMDSNASASLKSVINFKGAEDREYAKDFIKSTKIQIPDIFNLERDIHLARKDMGESLEKLNAAGLNIARTSEDGINKVKITNDRGDVIFIGETEEGADTPKVTYSQGKFMPRITLEDESLGDKKIMMLGGSKIQGNGFKFVMPGRYTNYESGEKKSISFTGKIAATTLNKEQRTQNAIDLYMNSDLADKVTPGDYKDFVEKYEPTGVCPLGGFGERFEKEDDENKPSSKLPTVPEYRILGTPMSMFASAGIINSEDPSDNEVIYLSQNHEIDGGDVKHVQKYKTDGGAIAEGLDEDYIDRHKDIIVLNGDIISNADITRPYHALKTLPHAALVIPYYPVSADRAKSFGLLGVEQDKEGNTMIKSFIEKPAFTDKAPVPEDFQTDEAYDKAMEEYNNAQNALNPDDGKTFLANPGMYFLSPEATKVLRHMGIKDPKSTGLGASIMPEIVKLCNEGELKDKDGNAMKVYTVPLEAKGGQPAFWDDIGTVEAYMSTIKKMARETREKGFGPNNQYYGFPEFALIDFIKNTDLDTGILYMSQKCRDSAKDFKKAYDVSDFEGHILVQ